MYPTPIPTPTDVPWAGDQEECGEGDALVGAGLAEPREDRVGLAQSSGEILSMSSNPAGVRNGSVEGKK